MIFIVYIERFKDDQPLAFSPSFDLAPPPHPPPFPVDWRHTGRQRKRDNLHTGEWGAKSYYSEKARGRTLKGPKFEIFGSGVFTQIRPVWVGDLGTRPKIQNFDGLDLKIALSYFLALSPSSLKILNDIADST